MAKKSKSYWVKRAEALENRANDKGEALAKKFKREYERAAKEIRAKIDAFYGRYATEQGLSYAEAVKRLNSKEAREWKKTLGEYVDEINAMPKGKAKDKLIAELDARSYASQQDRLSSLNAQIEMELDRLFASGEQQMTATMTDVFEDGYYRKMFDLQQRAGVISPFSRLSTDMIEEVLTYPWSGSDFSTGLWNNKRALLFNTRATITQGLIQGQSVARMSKSLADTMGKSYHQAETLIRTETNHFHAEADTRAYEAAGVEDYEFVSTLDSRTSEICASLDGKHFPIKEAKTGVNYPPMHPRCRSTTVEYDPEDAADWAASGQPMPENMTYEEWQKEQEVIGKGSGKAGDTDGESKIERVWDVDFSDEKEISKIQDEFFKTHAYSDKEYAVIVSPENKAYYINGGEYSVNTELAGEEALKGCISIHNHPVPKGTNFDDSFSIFDFKSSAKYKSKLEVLISGERKQAYYFLKDITEAEAEMLYKKAEMSMLSKAFESDREIKHRQLDTMKELDLMGVIKFYELR